MSMKVKYHFFRLVTAFTRKIFKFSRYHHLALSNAMLAKQFELPKHKRKYHPTPAELKAYNDKWSKFGASAENIYVKNAAAISGYFDINIVPSDIYFSVIEPALNNRKFALSYEDKSRIDWINKPEHVPTILVRNINGIYYNSKKEALKQADIDLQKILDGANGVVAKKSIELHGGKGVEMFDRTSGGVFKNSRGEVLTLNYLEAKYQRDFIIQQQVNQHPYYKAFNASSLNTFRVLTYRSVLDNTIHILYSFLRIGAYGSRVDNISSGGLFLCVKPDGTFYDYGLSRKGKKVYQLKGNPPFKELEKPPFLKEIYELSKDLAKKHYYNRLLAFDMAVNSNGTVMHIETNTSDIGIEGLQYVMGPIFNGFTDEVLDYCQDKLSKTSKYHLYDN